MTILVDMDDTIEGLMDSWLDFIHKKHGIELRSEDIKEWDMRKAFPTLTSDEIFAPLFEERMWQNVKPFRDAIEYLPKLIEAGHDVVIVTASHFDTVAMKVRNVLLKHFPFIKYDNVIIASRKQLIRGDVLVDDAPHNLIGGDYAGILFNAPHNRSFPAEEHGFKRASNWKEVFEIIQEIDLDIQIENKSREEEIMFGCN